MDPDSLQAFAARVFGDFNYAQLAARHPSIRDLDRRLQRKDLRELAFVSKRTMPRSFQGEQEKGEEAAVFATLQAIRWYIDAFFPEQSRSAPIPAQYLALRTDAAARMDELRPILEAQAAHFRRLARWLEQAQDESPLLLKHKADEMAKRAEAVEIALK